MKNYLKLIIVNFFRSLLFMVLAPFAAYPLTMIAPNSIVWMYIGATIGTIISFAIVAGILSAVADGMTNKKIMKPIKSFWVSLDILFHFVIVAVGVYFVIYFHKLGNFLLPIVYSATVAQFFCTLWYWIDKSWNTCRKCKHTYCFEYNRTLDYKVTDSTQSKIVTQDVKVGSLESDGTEIAEFYQKQREQKTRDVRRTETKKEMICCICGDTHAETTLETEYGDWK